MGHLAGRKRAVDQVEFALILRELWSRRRILAVGVVIALIAAILSVYHVDGFGLKSRPISYSSASVQALIDTPRSALADVRQDITPLQARATVLANFMASPGFLTLVGQRVGLTGNQIYAQGPVDPQLPRTQQEPTALKRNVELTGETKPYRLTFNSDPNLPQIGIYSQAPTTKLAVELADASVRALQQYVSNLESTTDVPAGSRAEVRQLGAANGAPVNAGVSKSIFVLVFVAITMVWCVLMLVVTRFRENWRIIAEVERASAGPVAETPTEIGPGERLPRAEDPRDEPVPDWQRAAGSAIGRSLPHEADTETDSGIDADHGSETSTPSSRGTSVGNSRSSGNGSGGAELSGSGGTKRSKVNRQTRGALSR